MLWMLVIEPKMLRGFLCCIMFISGIKAVYDVNRIFKQKEHVRGVSTFSKQYIPNGGWPFLDTIVIRCIAACTPPFCSAVNFYDNGTCEHIHSTSFELVEDDVCHFYTDQSYVCPVPFGHLFLEGTPGPDGEYKPSCYQYLPENGTWLTLRDTCRLLGGDLVTLESAKEKSYILQLGLSLGAQDSTWIWTSASDDNEEGVWKWTATGSLVQYSDWRSGEPNNAGKEDCLAMRFKASQSWNDFKCERRFTAFCEITADLWNI